VDVVIIGAGIGGLTAALALEGVGIKARVYESVEELRLLGVGINLLPHATKVLGECGHQNGRRSRSGRSVEEKWNGAKSISDQ
jgi:2-polyprenyl-6-methoxyphenol hydroxylase-like FAD-dependent oxidoreductase